MARWISRLVTRGNGSLLPDPVTVSRCLAAVLFFVLLEFFKCSSACLPCCAGCFFPLARHMWNASTRVRDLGDGVMIHASQALTFGAGYHAFRLRRLRTVTRPPWRSARSHWSVTGQRKILVKTLARAPDRLPYLGKVSD
jgi:hypothetical protein